MSFARKLTARIAAADSQLCVGLDPDPARLPEALRDRPDGLYSFCAQVAAATAAHACAFKPQFAHFASRRAEDQLERLIAHLHDAHPGIPVILDAKRGDIGSTAEHYALEAFARYGADAVTLSPYLGRDALEPFLRWPDRAVYLLCRTSNPGSDELQLLDVGGERLYERVARLAAGPWHREGQVGLVVGATYPEELARVRTIAPALPLLVPGIGAQGGDLGAAQRAAAGSGNGAVVFNSSRAIIHASEGPDFATAAAAAARATCEQIRATRGAR